MKIQIKDQIYFFKNQQIIRFEAHQLKSIMHLSNGKSQTLDIPIENIDKQLIHTGFIRVHPNHIINVNFISNISNTSENTIILEGGFKVSATRNKAKQIIKLLENHI